MDTLVSLHVVQQALDVNAAIMCVREILECATAWI